MQQYIDKIIDVPQEKVLERIVDETDVPVSRVMEKIIKVVRQEISVLTETMKEKTGRQRNWSDEVEKLKSQLTDGESTLPADKEPASKLDGSCAAQAPEWMELQTLRAEELTAIHVEGVKPIPHERVLSNTVEQMVAVPVPQIREEIGQEIQLIPQSRISECVSEQTVNIPIQQSSMVQKSQKTIETPQHMDKVADFPHVQEGQTVQKTVEIPVGVSMTAESRAPAVQAAQKTVKCARVKFLDKIADVPVVVQRQVPMVVQREVSAVPAGQKVEDVQAQFTDEKMHIPVAQHRQKHMLCTVQETGRHRDEDDMPVADQQQPVVRQRRTSTVQCAQGTIEVPRVRSTNDVMDVPAVKQRRVSNTTQTARDVEVPRVIPQELVRPAGERASVRDPSDSSRWMVACHASALWKFPEPLPTTGGARILKARRRTRGASRNVIQTRRFRCTFQSATTRAIWKQSRWVNQQCST